MHTEVEPNLTSSATHVGDKVNPFSHLTFYGCSASKQYDSLVEQYMKAINQKDKQLHEFVRSLHEQSSKWRCKESCLTEELKDIREKLRKKSKEAHRLKLKEASNSKTVTELSLLVDQLKCKILALERGAISSANVCNQVRPEVLPSNKELCSCFPIEVVQKEENKKEIEAFSYNKEPLRSPPHPDYINGLSLLQDGAVRGEGGTTLNYPHLCSDFPSSSHRDNEKLARKAQLRESIMDPCIISQSSGNSLREDVEEPRGMLDESRRLGASDKASKSSDRIQRCRNSSSLTLKKKSDENDSESETNSNLSETKLLSNIQDHRVSYVESIFPHEMESEVLRESNVKVPERYLCIETLQPQHGTTDSEFNDLPNKFCCMEKKYHHGLLMIQKEREELRKKMSRVQEGQESEDAQKAVATALPRLQKIEDSHCKEVEELKKMLKRSQDLAKQLEECKEKLKDTSSQLELTIAASSEKELLSLKRISEKEDEIKELQNHIATLGSRCSASELEVLEEQWMVGCLQIENVQCEERLQRSYEKLKNETKILGKLHQHVVQIAQQEHTDREIAMRREIKILETKQEEERRNHQVMCAEAESMVRCQRNFAFQFLCTNDEFDNRRKIDGSEASERWSMIIGFFHSQLQGQEHQYGKEKEVLQIQLNDLKEKAESWSSACTIAQRRSEEVEKVTAQTVHDLTAIRKEAQLNLVRSFVPSSFSQSKKIPSLSTSNGNITSSSIHVTPSSSPPLWGVQSPDCPLRSVPAAISEDPPSSCLAPVRENALLSTRPFEHNWGSLSDSTTLVAKLKSEELQAILAQKLENEKISQELHILALQSGYDQIHLLENALSSKIEEYNSLKSMYRELEQQLKESEAFVREADEKVKEQAISLQEMREKYKKERLKMDALVQQYADKAAHASEEERASRRREASLLEELEKYEAAFQAEKQKEFSHQVSSTRSSERGFGLAGSFPPSVTAPSHHVRQPDFSFPHDVVSKEVYDDLKSELSSLRGAYENLEHCYHQSLNDEKIFFVDAAYRLKSLMSEVFLDMMVGNCSLGLFEVERSFREMCYKITLSRELVEKKASCLEKQLNSLYEKLVVNNDHSALQWDEKDDMWHGKLASALKQAQVQLQQERRERHYLEDSAAVERNGLERKLEEKENELISLHASNDRHKKEVQHYKDQMEKVLNQLKEAESAAGLGQRQLEARLQEARLEVNALRAQLNNAEIKEGQLLSEIKTLQQDVALAKQREGEKEKDLQSEKIRVKEAVHQLEEITTERNNSFAEALLLQEKINAMTIKISAAKGLSQREAMQRTELQAALESQLDDLESRLTSALAEKRALERQLEALRSQIDTLYHEAETQRVLESEQQGIIQEKCSEISILREKVANEDSIQHILKNSLRESQERESNLRLQLDELRRSHQILKISLTTLQQHVERNPQEGDSFNSKDKKDCT